MWFIALSSTHCGKSFDSLQSLTTALLLRTKHLLGKGWLCKLSHCTALLWWYQLPVTRFQISLCLPPWTFHLFIRRTNKLCIWARCRQILMRTNTAVTRLRLDGCYESLSWELSLIVISILIGIWSWVFTELRLLLKNSNNYGQISFIDFKSYQWILNLLWKVMTQFKFHRRDKRFYAW